MRCHIRCYKVVAGQSYGTKETNCDGIQHFVFLHLVDDVDVHINKFKRWLALKRALKLKPSDMNNVSMGPVRSPISTGKNRSVSLIN